MCRSVSWLCPCLCHGICICLCIFHLSFIALCLRHFLCECLCLCLCQYEWIFPVSLSLPYASALCMRLCIWLCLCPMPLPVSLRLLLHLLLPLRFVPNVYDTRRHDSSRTARCLHTAPPPPLPGHCMLPPSLSLVRHAWVLPMHRVLLERSLGVAPYCRRRQLLLRLRTRGCCAVSLN
jgi:hypothetical protein